MLNLTNTPKAGDGDWLYEILIDYRIDLDKMKPAEAYLNAKQAIQAHLHQQAVRYEGEVRAARLEIAKMYSAIGRDDYTWGSGGLPEEVLRVFPSFRSSTADVPRGKKQFMDFVLAQLTDPSTGSGADV